MLVIVGRRDENADLMKQGTPVQLLQEFIRFRPQLLVYRQRIISDPYGALFIHSVAPEHVADRFFTAVFLGFLQINIPHDPHSQASLNRFDHVDAEIFRQHDQNRQTAQNRRSPFCLDSVKPGFIDMTGLDQFLFQKLEILQCHTPVANPVHRQNFCCGPNRAG